METCLASERAARGSARTIGLIVALLGLSAAARASRMPLSVEFNVLKSDLVVEVKETDRQKGTVSVEKVFLGPAKPGDTFVVEGLSKVEHKVSEWIPKSRRTRGKAIEGAKALLFLVRGKEGRDWELFDSIFGVRWIVGDEVYTWLPIVMTPGPYAFLSGGPKYNVESLYQAIQRGLEKRAKFQAALRQEEPAQRVKGLLDFIRPGDDSSYESEALRELRGLGAQAARAVCEQAALDGQPGSRRREILYALGCMTDSSSVPYLLDVAGKSKAAMGKDGRSPKELKASPQEYEAYLDWAAALDALRRLRDARALDAFSDALLWGVRNRDPHVLHGASMALAECPARESLAAFKAALDLSPHNDREGFSDARWRLVLGLGRLRFPEAVPLLASQLDYPWGGAAKEARQALARIVGKDLGPQKELWLKWYEQHHSPEAKE